MKNLIGIITLVFALGCNRAAAQGDSASVKTIHVVSKCKVLDDSEWEKVELRKLESRDQPKNFKLSGEHVIKVHGKINSIDDLNAKELMEIKKFVAKYRCCVAYVDVSGVEDSPQFPSFASKGEIYFYFGTDK